MDNTKIGGFIAKLRKEKNITQKELADSLNVTNKAISKWERGICYPDITILQDLCNILDITLIELFNGEKISTDSVTNDFANQILEDSVVYSQDIIKNEDKRFKKRSIVFSFSIIMVLIIGIVIVDYNRYLNYKEPAFSFLTTTAEYHENDKITEYYGFGYKVIEYQTKNGKNILEFGSYFKKKVNINLDQKVIDMIEEELKNNNKMSRNGSECFVESKILSTEEFNNNLIAYLWLVEKCYVFDNNETIEDSAFSSPFKVSLIRRENDYVFNKFDFPNESNYESQIDRLFPKAVKILIDVFYATEHSEYLNESISKQVDEFIQK